MPSVPELVRQFGIAPSTAQTAVEALRREGLIVRRRGSGTFVAERHAVAAAAVPPAPASHKKGKETLAVLALYSVPFFRHFVDHITAHAAARGVAATCRYDTSARALADALVLEAQSPAGFLVVGWELESVARELLARGHQVVLFGEPSPGSLARVPSVYGNSKMGGYLATRRLLEMGHRRLLCVHGFASDDALRARRRWQGHTEALREAGLAPDHPVLGCDPARWLGNLDAVEALFGGPAAPTGVIAWSDEDALGFASALAQIGVRVPGDVSLVAYGNLPAGRHADPPLDTIDPHLDVQIEHAFALLSDAPAADNRSVPTALVTPTLVPRASCARFRAAALP